MDNIHSRFILRISGLVGKYKIWDSHLECYYRKNGKELEYKSQGKALRMLSICNRNWPT